MNGRSFLALSSICFLAWANKTAGSHNYHRYNELEVVHATDDPLNVGRELPLVRSTEKEPNVISKTFPPRLATNTELKQYKHLVETTIKKSKLSSDGANMNTIQVDDLLTAKIKHAVLPDPFTTVVQAFNVRFRGHYPNDTEKEQTCRVAFEWVQIHAEPDRIVSPPTYFICNKRKEGDASTTAWPIVEAATVNPKTTFKVLGKTGNADKSVQIETSPKDEMKTGQRKGVENHPKNDDVPTKKSHIVKDQMKVVHLETKSKNRY